LAAAFSTDGVPIHRQGSRSSKALGTGTMRRFAFAAVMIVLLPASAYAQEERGPPTVRSEREMKDDAAIDKKYQETVKRAKDSEKAAKTDPWQTVRPIGSDTTKR
jgi:hypothetical protein